MTVVGDSAPPLSDESSDVLSLLISSSFFSTIASSSLLPALALLLLPSLPSMPPSFSERYHKIRCFRTVFFK